MPATFSTCGPRLLHRAGFEIAAEIFPVRNLSGDFFNVSDVGPTTLLAIGDIGGKGLLAGIWFTYMLGLTRMYGESFVDPSAAAATMNNHLCRAEFAPPLTSMFLARLQTSTGELVYRNAGHPSPILRRAGGELEFLQDGGPVIGAVPQAAFQSAHVALRAGYALIGYSDGLLECRNEHDEEFGMQRLIAELQKPAASTQAMLFSIIGAAQDFAGSQAREDDCALMIVQRKDVG